MNVEVLAAAPDLDYDEFDAVVLIESGWLINATGVRVAYPNDRCFVLVFPDGATGVVARVDASALDVWIVGVRECGSIGQFLNMSQYSRDGEVILKCYV